MSIINKTAYPNGGEDIYVSPPHNISEWIKAARHIYADVNKGIDYNKAFDTITNGWDKMTQLDFKNWMKYYQSNGDSGYKKANLEKKAQYFPAFLEADDLRATLPGNKPQFKDADDGDEEIVAATVNKQTEKQKADQQAQMEKELIEQQIKALIGRLNSAEKIATTPGIAKTLGPSFENWVRALHELKKEIQVAPFRTTKSDLIVDLIIRKGNQLSAFGDNKAAKIMYKLAQIAPPPLDAPEEGSDKPNEAKLPEGPAEPSLTDPLPESNTEPMNSSESKKDDDWAEEFLNGLNGIIDDKNEIMDVSASDDLYVSDELNVYAQEVPMPASIPEPGADITQAIPSPEGNKLEQALSGTTVDDVIAKLEAVSNIFKNREVPRQLAMVDIMLDQLGISQYFPELGEATSKALESNQYCATRIEDVLGRLKGGVEVPSEHALDLEGTKPGGAEANAVGLKAKLEQEKQKTDARKKNREDAATAQEDAQVANQTAPTEAINTDALNQPTQVQAPGPGVRV